MRRLMRRPRPLDRVRSIKVKLGLVVTGSVVVTVGAIYGTVALGLHARFAFAGGLLLSLAVVQVLAHGMVMPLREMAAATRAMAGGDYHRRVTATALDEVGSLARSFNTMAARLEQSERQRRELVANVSHELRTPIAALRARLENAADGVEELGPDAVAAMLTGVGRLSRLVDQLLRLSEFEAGAVRLDRQPLPVREVIAEAVAEVQPASRGVRIVTDAAAGLAATGDPERVHEVLTNLISNAVRHSPPGGTVTVRAEATAGGTRVEVSDEGTGVPPADLERIFGRFSRLDPARQAAAGGAGLGLAIARSIVELHGGSIRAGACEPSGCRIVFDLPG